VATVNLEAAILAAPGIWPKEASNYKDLIFLRSSIVDEDDDDYLDAVYEQCPGKYQFDALLGNETIEFELGCELLRWENLLDRMGIL
jgi:hypothetical protein